MRRGSPQLILLALGIALSSQTAVAAHCTTYSTSATDLEKGIIVVEIGDLPFTADYHYALWDVCQPDCLFFYGFYQETNGISGLQRYDATWDDTCHGLIEADGYTF